MKKKGIWIASVMFCVSALFLVACGQGKQNTEEELYVGVACYNESDTYLKELLDCFKDSCSERSITVSIRDAVGSQRTQNDQVRELLGEGCKVLCVNLADRTDPSEIIDMAREENVPVIFFNREPVAEDMLQWEDIYYVGAYSRQSGMMQGEAAAELIWDNPGIDRNRDGKIQYVVLEGEAGHQDSIIRSETVVNTIKEKGIELERLGSGIANWNRAQAQNRMSQMISQHKDAIELVLSNNDAMALGAIDAYDDMAYEMSKRPVFFGIDGTREGLDALEEGKLSATVYNDKEGQAEAMAQLSEALLTGKGMEDIKFENGRYIYLYYQKVTPENLDEFLARKKK